MRARSEEQICPACGARLDFAPWQGQSPSDEICPCCGIQFGYDDAAGGDLEARSLAYDRWRDRWLSEGARWRSHAQPAPPGWSASEQLRRVGVEFNGEVGSRLTSRIWTPPAS